MFVIDLEFSKSLGNYIHTALHRLHIISQGSQIHQVAQRRGIASLHALACLLVNNVCRGIDSPPLATHQ